MSFDSWASRALLTMEKLRQVEGQARQVELVWCVRPVAGESDRLDIEHQGGVVVVVV